MLDIRWEHELTGAPGQAVRQMLLATRDLAEFVPTALPAEHGQHALGYVGAELAGYAHLDPGADAFGRDVVEMLVRPDHRGAGLGAALASAVLQRSAPSVRFWSHGDHPGAAALARRHGLTRVRELLRMHAAAEASRWAAPALPDGVRLRTFVPGRDEAAVVAVNARAFAAHPEQGALREADLRAAEHEEWFDPAGFFLAEDRAGELLGFHWTKVHPPGGRDLAGESVGEVYVLAVDPAAHGQGLGRVLTATGLGHLAGRGLGEVILYVEGDNPAAIAVYAGLGFGTDRIDVQYELAQ